MEANKLSYKCMNIQEWGYKVDDNVYAQFLGEANNVATLFRTRKHMQRYFPSIGEDPQYMEIKDVIVLLRDFDNLD